MVCLGRIFASIQFFHLVFSERANNGEVSHVFSPEGVHGRRCKGK
jgi:hypothetical protein